MSSSRPRDLPRVSIVADSIDGLNWQARLDEAFLVATDVSESLRPASDLIALVNQWWYEALH